MRYRWLTLMLGVSLLGCLGDDLGVDVGSGPDDARFDELRRRLAIEVRPGDGGYLGSGVCDERLDATSPCCNTTFCSARGLSTQIRSGCQREASPNRAAGTCGTAVRMAEDHVCTAQRLLQIIENPGEQELSAWIAGNQGGTLLIGPQDAESNTELALEALRYAASAQKIAGDALERVAPGATAGPACSRADFASAAGTGEFADLSLGGELAHFYAESLQLGEDAAELLARAASAVSDAQLSRATDRAEAAVLRNAPFASRAAAAHALIGGAHGLRAHTIDDTEGLFARPPLSRGGQQALTLLRTLALDPALIADRTIPVEHLVQGGPRVLESAPARASIRYRLTRFLGEGDLASASAAAIYRRVGVDADAISEARAWIAEEVRAFGRPAGTTGVRVSRVLPAERLPDGTMSDFPLFAATRIPPQQPLDVYWSAVVRYDPTPVPTPALDFSWPSGPNATGDLPPGATWGDEGWSGGLATLSNRSSGRTYASIREDAVLRARRLVGALSPVASDSPALRAELIAMRDTIAGLLPDGLGGGGSTEDGTFLGRARICGYNLPTATPPEGFLIDIDLTVAGVTSPAGLAVVVGQEGLDCAVRGTIDGTACTADELATYRPHVVLELTPLAPGRFVTIVGAAFGTGPTPELSAYFIVRRDPTATGALIPGAQEALTGFIVGSVAPGTLACTGTDITPDHVIPDVPDGLVWRRVAGMIL